MKNMKKVILTLLLVIAATVTFANPEPKFDPNRYNAELQHLIKVVGIVPDISLHKPWYRPHYQEYCFTLPNGKSIKVRDYDKRPSKVEKEALRLIRNLNKD